MREFVVFLLKLNGTLKILLGRKKKRKIGTFIGIVLLLDLIILILTYRSTSITVDVAEGDGNTLTYDLNSHELQIENHIDVNGEKDLMINIKGVII